MRVFQVGAKRALAFAGAALLLASVSACNYAINKTSKVDGSSYGIGTNSVAEQKALGVLATRCAGCHGGTNGSGGVSNILDPQALLNSGLIIPGNPSGSPLIISVESGRMPPTGALPAAEIAILRDWVAGGGAGTGGSITPLPFPTPLPPTPVTGTLEQKAVAILQNNCYACHGTVANGGIDRINDPVHLISIGAIVPGSAVTSKIYDSISKNRMPPSGPLSAADISIIADWINQGAKAPAPGTVAPAPTPIPLTATFTSINANIITPKCVGCHSATVAKGGIRLDSYQLVMGYVSKTKPAESKLYTITKSGEMPPPPNAPLGGAELQVILSWISAGALNN